MKHLILFLTYLVCYASTASFTLQTCTNVSTTQTSDVGGISLTQTNGSSVILFDFIWVEDDGLYLALEQLIIVKLNTQLSLEWAKTASDTFSTTKHLVLEYTTNKLTFVSSKAIYELNSSDGSLIKSIGITGTNWHILGIARNNYKTDDFVFILYCDTSTSADETNLSKFNMSSEDHQITYGFTKSTTIFGLVDHFDQNEANDPNVMIIGATYYIYFDINLSLVHYYTFAQTYAYFSYSEQYIVATHESSDYIDILKIETDGKISLRVFLSSGMANSYAQ